MDWTGSYCGPPPDAATWALNWNLDPVLIAGLAIAAMLAVRLPAERRTAGLAGVGVCALVFVSPLCALSVALFAARTVHHLLLVAVAAPLLAVAVAPPRALPVAPTLVIATAVLWTWHLPALYDAALTHKGVYWVMQASLLATAAAFWVSVRTAPPATAMAGIAAAGGQMGLLGALLTFAPEPLYAAHLAATVPFGIGPLADQQLSGLIMWVPGLMPYAVAAALLGRRQWRSMAAPA